MMHKPKALLNSMQEEFAEKLRGYPGAESKYDKKNNLLTILAILYFLTSQLNIIFHKL